MDITKYIVIGAVVLGLTFYGIFGGGGQQDTGSVVSTQVTNLDVAPVSPVVPATAVTSPKSLEMLGPVYSEKGIFQDGTVYVAFDAVQRDTGVASAIKMWLHNSSSLDVIQVLWDRCSIQLPDGNTVGVLSENALKYVNWTGRIIAVAPGGDVFDAIIPVTEASVTDTSYTVTSGVLDAGVFTLVLAIEHSRAIAAAPYGSPAQAGGTTGKECSEQAPRQGPEGVEHLSTVALSDTREVVYYTFRFIIR